LAVLAALAVAGDAGLSREKLVGLLWPESDTERARHSLTQAMYLARRAVQIEDLFLINGENVRLNGERIASDVRELEDRLGSGDLERAVDVYRGPFLDGFFLSGSPEFDQWSAQHRDRIQAKFADALDQLAERAEVRGDRARGLEWRRRLAALLPLDSGRAAKLMAAMAAAGDRAGALQHARLHATLLRQQLDLDPDPMIEALAEQLRAATTATVRHEEGIVPAQRITAESSSRAGMNTDSPAETSHSTVAAAASGPIQIWELPRSSYPRWRRATILAGAFAFAAAIVVLAWRGTRESADSVQPLAVRQRVVVAPFRVAGAEASLAYLRQGIVELLSARLADDSAARSVDAGAVLGAWRAAGLTSSIDVTRGTVVALAARLGAERVVVGSVVGTSARAVLSATVLLVPAGTVSAQASVSGPADSITTLIDRLAARLLVSEAGSDESLAQLTSRSLPALQAFLAGQAAFRQSDYAGALRHYDRALARDSTFALAALHKADAADILSITPALQSAVRLAWSSRDDLNEHDRLLLSTLSGPRYPAIPTAAELTGAWQQIVDRAPGSGGAWYVLGVRLLKDGAPAGVPESRARAVATLQRALTANPENGAVRRLLARLIGRYELPNGTPSAQRADSLDSLFPSTRWRMAIAAGDSAALRSVRASFMRLGPANLRRIALVSQYDALGLDDGRAAIAALQSRGTTSDHRADVLLAEHSLTLNQGRATAALDATARLRRAYPGSDAWLRLRVLDALYGGGDSSAAVGAAHTLAVLTNATPPNVPTTWDAWLANACVVGQWRLARTDTNGVQAIIAVLRSRQAAKSGILVGATPEACAELLEASLAVTLRQRDARSRVLRLDSLAFTPQVAGDAAAYAPLFVARLFERLDDRASALRAIRKRGYMGGWPRYLAAMRLQEGRFAEQVGAVEDARSAYEEFLRYRGGETVGEDSTTAAVRRRLEVLDEMR
jgi:DNA-binding SARP family transcriptional activator